MMRATLTAIGLCLAVTGLGYLNADARPLFVRGGSPNGAGGGGTAQACDSNPTNVCAQFQDGQTFVTWPDADTGSAGEVYRYRVVRSTAPITSGNYGSATVIAKYVQNNSAQLANGDPTSTATAGANPYQKSYVRDGTRPRARLSDLGTQLDAFTGLQAYTALATADAYYAVIRTDTSDASDSYIGSVGPIAESVQPWKMIKQYDSSRDVSGQISGPTAGDTLVVRAHGSSKNSGCTTNRCDIGDYWLGFGTVDDGWEDGRQMTLEVMQASSTELWARVRDTIIAPNLTRDIEWYHSGGAFTPTIVDAEHPANRWYPFVSNGESRQIMWAIDHYGLDPNKVHWWGQSMGASAGALSGMRSTAPHYASVELVYPVFVHTWKSCSHWHGDAWASDMPHRATLAAAPCTLTPTTTDPSTILMPDGSPWSGTGGYIDMPTFYEANPEVDLPFMMVGMGKTDASIIPSPSNGTMIDNLAGYAAMKAAKRGYAVAWSMGNHDNGSTAGLTACADGGSNSDACYPLSVFALNLPYIATANSSIDDDLGTGTQDAFGFFDGDPAGCINCGFKWTISSDSAGAFNFTIDNTWMDKDPIVAPATTVHPSTTITASMASSGETSVTVTDGSVFMNPASGNNYFSIGDTEIIRVISVAGNTVNYSSDSNRGRLWTTARSHSAGETITQYRWQTKGPVNGPFTTMTVDLTPRRIQNFTKGKTNGQVIACDITPNGGSLTTQTPTVTDNLFTLTGVIINSSGATVIACD